jgi:hypothetical protein
LVFGVDPTIFSRSSLDYRRGRIVDFFAVSRFFLVVKHEGGRGLFI